MDRLTYRPTEMFVTISPASPTGGRRDNNKHCSDVVETFLRGRGITAETLKAEARTETSRQRQGRTENEAMHHYFCIFYFIHIPYVTLTIKLSVMLKLSAHKRPSHIFRAEAKSSRPSQG